MLFVCAYQLLSFPLCLSVFQQFITFCSGSGVFCFVTGSSAGQSLGCLEKEKPKFQLF